MTILLKAEGLTKKFGAKSAVDNVSFDVKKGEVLGFLGPNGAGKSTTMKMVAGFLSPSSGRAEICGRLVSSGDPIARQKMGYLAEGAPLYGDMTVGNFLSFIARSHAIGGADRMMVVESAAGALALSDVLGQTIETLSKGFRRRVGLAAAILHAPDVLVLDEPTDGLDPNQKYQVRRLIETMSKDRAIVISTHILEEVEALCNRAIIIHGGTIVADSTPLELKMQSKYYNAISLDVPLGLASEVIRTFRRFAEISSMETSEENRIVRLTLVAADRLDIAGLVHKEIASNGWDVRGFSVEAGRLDDVFRSLTYGNSLSGANTSGFTRASIDQ